MKFPPETPPMTDLTAYDAGLLNDFGGGDVEWWQDYIRAELNRAHDFYAAQVATLPPPAGGVPAGMTDEQRTMLKSALAAHTKAESGWMPRTVQHDANQELADSMARGFIANHAAELLAARPPLAVGVTAQGDPSPSDIIYATLLQWMRHFPPSSRNQKVDAAVKEIMSKLAMQGYVIGAASPPPPVSGEVEWKGLTDEIDDLLTRASRTAQWLRTRAKSPERKMEGADQEDIAELLYQLSIRVLPAAPPPSPSDGWRPTHRHVKRGTEYQVIGSATLQAQSLVFDDELLTIYRSKDGRIWVRSIFEFNDGRFEPLPAPPATSGEG